MSFHPRLKPRGAASGMLFTLRHHTAHQKSACSLRRAACPLTVGRLLVHAEKLNSLAGQRFFLASFLGNSALA